MEDRLRFWFVSRLPGHVFMNPVKRVSRVPGHVFPSLPTSGPRGPLRTGLECDHAGGPGSPYPGSGNGARPTTLRPTTTTADGGASRSPTRGAPVTAGATVVDRRTRIPSPLRPTPETSPTVNTLSLLGSSPLPGVSRVTEGLLSLGRVTNPRRIHHTSSPTPRWTIRCLPRDSTTKVLSLPPVSP